MSAQRDDTAGTGMRCNTGFHRFGLGLAIASLVLSGAAACAQTMPSGDQWLRQCSSHTASDTRACIDFIKGLDELNEFLGSSKLYCLRSDTTRAQMKAIIQKHLQGNPAKLHLPFAGLAIEALRNEYPCPKH
jgi:hypothetical protein